MICLCLHYSGEWDRSVCVGPFDDIAAAAEWGDNALGKLVPTAWVDVVTIVDPAAFGPLQPRGPVLVVSNTEEET